MKKEWADKWVAALRSGKYKQGQGYLRTASLLSPLKADSYCCLGVLCDMVDPKSWERKCEGYYAHKNTAIAVLGASVMLATGIKGDAGDIKSIDSDLTEINDSGKSFLEIADLIENHWEEL